METTIAIKESTAQMLALLKRKTNAKSMDELIVKVVRKAENISNSRFGSQPTLKSFTKKERGLFHEL